MKTIRILYLIAIVLLVALLTTGCEDSAITESSISLEDEIKHSEPDNMLTTRLERFNNDSGLIPGMYFDPNAKPMEIPPDIQAEIEAEKRKNIDQRHKELPEEIRQAQKQLYEGMQEFFDVDELPHIELAPGVHLGVPADILDEEEYSQYSKFIREQMRKLMQLHEEYGLRKTPVAPKKESHDASMQEISSSLQSLGWGDSFVNATRIDPSTVIGNYYAYTESYLIAQNLDVIVDVYADDFYLGQSGNQAWNTPFVDWDLRPVYAYSNPSCYSIYGDHWIDAGSVQDNFFSFDSQCA